MTYKEKLEEVIREIVNLDRCEISDFINESTFAGHDYENHFLAGAEWGLQRTLAIFEEFGEDFILDKEDR